MSTPSNPSEVPPFPALVKTAEPPMPRTPAAKNTYGQILKSSAMIGGSSVVTIIANIVRNKAMAVLLDRSGVGLMGLFSSALFLAQSIAGMGINSSGVRQIAEAVGSGESERVARTAAILRRTSLVLGILGALLMIVLCRQVSTWTFGNDLNAFPVALLSVALLCRVVSDGQGAAIQGMRRIGDLARIAVLSTIFGTAICLGLIYFLRERGVVPSLIAFAAVTLGISWWYRRKIQLPTPPVSAADVRHEAAALFKLGSAFMASAILTQGAGYTVRIIVKRQINLDAAGLYESAWAVGGMYVGFVLQAMASDFYPRLTGVAKDNAECNRLVNEQARISLLLAGPGVLGTLTFAPLLILALYSKNFTPAVEVFRWICLGMALRVVAWPMGFVVLAKGAQTILVLTELIAFVVHVGLAFVLVKLVGLKGAGIAFAGLYVLHSLLIYFIVRRLSAFRWTAENLRLGLLVLPSIAMVFSAFYVLPALWATLFGAVVTVLVSIYSFRTLLNLVSLDRVPAPLRRIFVRLGLAPANPN